MMLAWNRERGCHPRTPGHTSPAWSVPGATSHPRLVTRLHHTTGLTWGRVWRPGRVWFLSSGRVCDQLCLSLPALTGEMFTVSGAGSDWASQQPLTGAAPLTVIRTGHTDAILSSWIKNRSSQIWATLYISDNICSFLHLISLWNWKYLQKRTKVLHYLLSGTSSFIPFGIHQQLLKIYLIQTEHEQFMTNITPCDNGATLL